jgi:hypothetical protein
MRADFLSIPIPSLKVMASAMATRFAGVRVPMSSKRRMSFGVSVHGGVRGQILGIRSFGIRTKPFPGGAISHLCKLAV